MSNYQVLNKTAHADTKVITERSAEYGDNVKFAMTFPLEFRNIQSNYPIFFSKDGDTGQFYPVALFGFEEKENLFLSDSGWDATYIPMMIQRQPFLIGFQGPEEEKNAVASINMDNPRVNTEKGEALFTAEGHQTEYLQQALNRLEAIHTGHQHNKAFVAALLDNELLEPFTLEITLNDGSNNQLLGFYTVNEEKMLNLKGDTLERLNKEGYLQAIYMQMASFARIRALIDKKNALLGKA
ncbi:MAG: SapC family protein [Porticoccaceae bacterium]|nr:SapC family protein [Porticoccaceae bacterium]MBT5577768.1 SapC family protein [Porticoccaceae bacterium]MBT7376380.1 SapC family protein [Porticoccaceae bacterium]